ncbi:MAG: bifunctional 5,10-methylenetetrahydrofolate dehydrogenase/5,10-methenyltetrahydrofolate cyclohydrolase, partial [Chloroflexota bacterium]
AGRLHLGLPALRPSTPQGGIELLDHYGIDLEGKRAVVIGRSNIVGTPMATLMTRRNATVTLCHRKTVDLAHHVAQAEIVAVAAGSPGLIRGDMLREGAVVIDFGINVLGDGIVGDVDAASVMGVASGYTPVPGGTGPVTVMVLASNTIAAAFASMATPFEAAGDPIGASSLTR